MAGAVEGDHGIANTGTVHGDEMVALGLVEDDLRRLAARRHTVNAEVGHGPMRPRRAGGGKRVFCASGAGASGSQSSTPTSRCGASTLIFMRTLSLCTPMRSPQRSMSGARQEENDEQ